MNHRQLARAALPGLAVATAALAPAVAGAASMRTTFLLSRAADGGFPNGPSRSPAVSHDGRVAQLMAYESDASNIVAGDVNGQTDVFAVGRAQPWGPNGTPWAIGPTTLVSVGLGGAPANGPSTGPSLDGDARHAPHCVAFVSAASNLVPGDTNGQPDAFVRDLRTNTTTRVSVASDGAQANGATTEVSIDGACERVAFTSTASNLALTSTTRPAWRSARTAQAGGRRQVYVHVLSGEGADAGFAGLTFLASASPRGAAGNGASYEPSFARAGKAVAFTSAASNLTGGDANGATDVFERTFTRALDRGRQTLRFDTRLVSALPSGRSGNGASSHPDVSDDGRYVAFQTTASDLLPGDVNGVSDVSEADMGGRQPIQAWVSRSRATAIGNGPSQDPSITGAGEFVLFDSDATNLKESSRVRDDANGQRDVFLWNRPTGNVSLESRAAPSAPGAKGGYLGVASGQPATSSRGNYVGFVSRGTGIDLPLIARLGGSAPPPGADLVYVRYLGPQ